MFKRKNPENSKHKYSYERVRKKKKNGQVGKHGKHGKSPKPLKNIEMILLHKN